MRRMVVTIILFLGMTCHAAEDRFTAGKFWSAFRQAVLTNDSNQILAMTRFPFEVYGVSSNTPAKHYDRREFPQILRKILMQSEYLPVGNRIVSKTVLGLIYDKRHLTHQDVQTSNAFRFSQLEFEATNGRWFLVRAYLEE